MSSNALGPKSVLAEEVAGSARYRSEQGFATGEIIDGEHLGPFLQEYWQVLLRVERPWQFSEWMKGEEGQPGYTFGDWKENVVPPYRKENRLVLKEPTGGCFETDFGVIPKYIRKSHPTWQQFLSERREKITDYIREKARCRDYKNLDLLDFEETGTAWQHSLPTTYAGPDGVPNADGMSGYPAMSSGGRDTTEPFAISFPSQKLGERRCF